jgi:pilus assembly protein CpaC
MDTPFSLSPPSCVGSPLVAKSVSPYRVRLLPRGPACRAASVFLAMAALLFFTSVGSAQTLPSGSIVRKLENSSERMEMIVNTSRILTLDRKIPQAQVNNPEIVQIVPLAPDQIQISAKRAGVTQVNLWTEDKSIYTVDVIVFGDARELTEVLKSQFPNASLTVTPVANSVRISGYVDQPEHVPQIIRIAEEYYPKVINSITVSGVQQVLLHVRVMEVSRTKLRKLGFDFAHLNGNNLIASSVGGLLEGSVASYQGVVTDGSTFNFQVVDAGSSFFGILEALREDKLLKILAEPNVVAISGRPASFLAGGSVPTLVPQSLGTVTVEYKDYGTQVDFVPIVLGNGKIRLEVRPHVSEIDNGRSIQFQGYTIYAFTERRVETGVELKAGQTLAIAGLIQNRVESTRTGLPWISEVPYLRALFSKTENLTNEIELLVLVTPELVDPLNPDQVPPCGPGTTTTEPNDWELYLKGFVEVPRCPPCGNDGAATEGGPCESAPQAMPGMVGEPQPEAAADGAGESSSTDVRQTREIRYNPVIPQTAQAPRNPNSAKTLPAFKGRVGYEMLR